jgi:hypothetical protein
MKKKLVILFSFASLMGIQTSQAYRIKCPAPYSISAKQVKDQFEYSAKVEGHKKMIMIGFHKEHLDLSIFSFEGASSSSDNRLFCSYTDPKGGVMNLVTSLKKGSACTVFYPNGHKHPALSYFKCTD